MFDDADPLLVRLRSLCLALPEVEERISHGRPTWRVAKQFAQYGGGERTPDGHVRHDHALLFVPEPGDVGALDQDERFFLPAYVGPFGWRAVDLDRDDVGWDEVAELVDASYRQVANRRQLAALAEL
ncbi:MmcQ/YjbR family DNA-binding protein [Nocardioides marmoribigeumensis]